MIAFLTSSPCSPGEAELSTMNGLREELHCALPPRPLRCVYLAASPVDYAINDLYSALEKERWEAAGFVFSEFLLYDNRCNQPIQAALAACDLLFLAGGHVPTQNDYYTALELRHHLESFSGVIFGISAGSMNAAAEVYALPERPGEAADPHYRKFYSGLGLTHISIIPHLQELRHVVLDGQRTIEDIACGDSHGRRFYALPDGSYLLCRDGKTQLRGEAYCIQNGRMEKISCHGQWLSV